MPSGIFTKSQVNQAITSGAWTNRPPITVDYLVVAGGGGGGRNWGGGGGGGGLLQGNLSISTGTSYTVTVGAGGSGGTNDVNQNATSGGSSVFGSITANGGGYGGMYNNQNPASGGSGGGAGSGSGPGVVPGQGTAGQGNTGGVGDYGGANSCTGGGGGAGTVGQNASSSVAGYGGAGIASAISGTITSYAGGGGGCSNSGGTPGVGGIGGGGNGGKYGTSEPTGGANNTGGGGGGGQYLSTGGNGGSGIVIVSYPGTTQWFSGGAVNYYNGRVVHVFRQSGVLAPIEGISVDPSYKISRSLRFNSEDSAYLNRTPASAGNRKTWTWSNWVKRGRLGAYSTLFGYVRSDGIQQQLAWFTNDDRLQFYVYNSGYNVNLVTTQVFRDSSAWYHIVFVWDTTQATEANRLKIYVNNVEITSFSTSIYPVQNSDGFLNLNVAHGIGTYAPALGDYFNGYMTEINFIDGQALTPSSFGETNSATGVWQPKAYTGTYGTNGFYLNFSDNTNTQSTTLGKDYSGNGNDWVPNNFSVTAGVGNDSLIDTPTPYGADTGLGGEVRGNYCTLNPITTAAGTFTQGNLRYVSNNSWRRVNGTIAVSTGKWYWEVTLANNPNSRSSNADYNSFGVGVPSTTMLNATPANQTDLLYLGDHGWYKNFSGSVTDGGVSFAAGDVLAIALDLDANTFTFFKNNSRVVTGTIGGTPGRELTPILNSYSNAFGVMDFNFGQRPFAYTAPAGFRALTSYNLPTPDIGSTASTQAGKYFNAVTYTGNGNTTSQAITGVGFQPDFVWLKARSQAYEHILSDAVRGAGKIVYSSLNNAEATVTNFNSFDSDGFNVDAGGGASSFNENNTTYVAWNWKANGAGSSNTAGSITSTVSASPLSGFSIVTYVGTGSAGTIGHGLGATPSMIFVKRRTASTAQSWQVFHSGISGMKDGYIYLNSTGAFTSGYSAIWNGTNPTSTVFSVGNDNDTNASGGLGYVAYCFAPVAGFSAFGRYTGNGSTDGPFVYTGFRPRYVLIKSTAAGRGWSIFDTVRGTFNVNSLLLEANTGGAEINSSSYQLDILSNGLKIRTDNQSMNWNGDSYIYAAFAESPFKYALAR